MGKVIWNIFSYITFTDRDRMQFLEGVSGNANVTEFQQKYGIRVNGAEISAFAVIGVFAAVVYIFSLLLLSMDSYMSVRWPLKYSIGEMMTKKRAFIMVVVVWVFAFMVAVLPLISQTLFGSQMLFATFMDMPTVKADPKFTDQHGIVRYWHGFTYASVVWGLPFIASWLLNIGMAIRSRRMLSSMKAKRRASVNASNKIAKIDRGVVITVFVLLSLYTLSIIPVFSMMVVIVINTGSQYCNSIPHFSTYLLITSYIYTACNILNVFVYNVFQKEFRNASKKLFYDVLNTICCCCCGSDVIPQYNSRSQLPSRTSTKHTKTTSLQWLKRKLSRSSDSDKKVVVDRRKRVRSTSSFVSSHNQNDTPSSIDNVFTIPEERVRSTSSIITIPSGSSPLRGNDNVFTMADEHSL